MLPSPVKTADDAPDPELEARRAQCVAKGLPMSPYKLNLVAKMVRGMSVQEALDQLEASPKRAAIPIYKVGSESSDFLHVGLDAISVAGFWTTIFLHFTVAELTSATSFEVRF